jgi:hypothetical protein
VVPVLDAVLTELALVWQQSVSELVLRVLDCPAPVLVVPVVNGTTRSTTQLAMVAQV